MSTASPLSIRLPGADRRLEAYTLSMAPPLATAAPKRPFTRIAYSAAHVVADPLATVDPWLTAALDWDATIAYRQRLWSEPLAAAQEDCDRSRHAK